MLTPPDFLPVMNASLQAALEPEQIWWLLRKLRQWSRTQETLPTRFGFKLDEHDTLALMAADDPAALIEMTDAGSWIAKTSITQASAEWLDLYLPMTLACRKQPLTVAHLGQSLDGRIATACGASRHINGAENLTHLHRMRALCDAIIVGASTVEYDDPQLTTRRVTGSHPTRVVLDPHRRLAAGHYLFQDRTAPTLLVCAETLADRPGPGHAEVIGVPFDGQRLSLQEILRRLRERGLFGLFVEGGGLTVSAFLEAGLLDRLHMAIAPLIIGSGRAGITLPVISDLSQGLRPRHRRYEMGEDVLFDCQLRD